MQWSVLGVSESSRWRCAGAPNGMRYCGQVVWYCTYCKFATCSFGTLRHFALQDSNVSWPVPSYGSQCPVWHESSAIASDHEKRDMCAIVNIPGENSGTKCDLWWLITVPAAGEIYVGLELSWQTECSYSSPALIHFRATSEYLPWGLPNTFIALHHVHFL